MIDVMGPTVDSDSLRKSGGISGPGGAISHYEIHGYENPIITFGSEERPGAYPMYVHDMLHHLEHPYHIQKPKTGWREHATFGSEEKAKLRPVAETLAMLDRNAFFGDPTWYEGYLPEAAALYENNGGDGGHAGQASFARDAMEGDGG